MSDEIRETLRETLGEMRGAETAGADASGVDVAGSPGPEAVGTDGVDASATPSPQSSDGSDAVQRSSDSPGRARDASGKFVKGAASPTETPKPGKESQAKPPAQGQPQATPPPQVGQTTPTPAPKYKAPQSWKPQAREKWASMAEEIQAEVDRREREIAQALNETAEPKKFHQSFQQALAPFQHMIRAEGLDPMQLFQGTLQFAAAMRTAPPAHKAQLIANVVKQFGIPIEALDSALAGESVQPSQQNQQLDPAQIRQQIKAELMQEMQAQRGQAYTQRAQQEVASFGADREFFEDVREDMRVLVTAAVQRGVEMSLEDAYNRALLMHKADEKSDIGDVLRQREASERAKAEVASTQRAREASSSVKSQPASVNGAILGEGSIRDTLREEIAAARRR